MVGDAESNSLFFRVFLRLFVSFLFLVVVVRFCLLVSFTMLFSFPHHLVSRFFFPHVSPSSLYFLFTLHTAG